MSESGDTPFIITAKALSYEPEKEKEYASFDRETLLKHATRCEALAAMQIQDEGIEVIDGPKICPICMERFHSERSGIHVEIDEGEFHLIGHLDRRGKLKDGRMFPIEIKSLGVNSYKVFRDKGFKAFPEYAAQEACYLHAENSPGIYWVMNRDNGSALKMIVNDFKNEINLSGFTHVELPITYEEICDNHMLACGYISNNQLPNDCRDTDEDPGCKYCGFRYLCPHRKEVATVPTSLVITDDMVEARANYKQGKIMEEQGKELQDGAKSILLNHAISSKTDKFYIEDMKFSYSGMTSKSSFDKDLFINDLPKVINILDVPKVIKLLNDSNKKSKPFPNVRITFAKDE